MQTKTKSAGAKALNGAAADVGVNPRGSPSSDAATTNPPEKEAKAGTFGALAEAYLSLGTAGPEAVQSALQKNFKEKLLPYSVVDPNTAVEVERADTVTAEDEIGYRNFSPPTLWQAPYTILRAHFTSKKKDTLIYHPGEELLIPISGEVIYDFWLYAGNPPEPHCVPKGPFSGRQVCRINPAVPHHTRAAGQSSAEAFMVFRDFRETSAAIMKPPTSKLAKDGPALHLRRVTVEELQNNPVIFWLSATRLAEKVRLFRTRTGLQIQELADRSDLDRGFLSRLEAGAVNISLANVVRIAEELGFDPFDVFKCHFWDCRVAPFPKPHPGELQTIDNLSFPENHHFLHAAFLSLTKGQSIEMREAPSLPLGTMSSWIALKGKVEFQRLARDPQAAQFLRAGSVLHLREPCDFTVEAFEDSELLEIRNSPSPRIKDAV